MADGRFSMVVGRRPNVVIPAVLLVMLALISLGVRLLLSGDGVYVRGPYGAFPAPVATQEPVHPGRLVRKAPGGLLVYQGVSVEEGPSDTVTAVDLRTGHTYWQYRRRHASFTTISIDQSTGDLFLLWDPHGSAQIVDRVGMRSGHRMWTHTLPDLGGSSGWRLMAPYGTGPLIAVGDNGMTAIDSRNGSGRWTTTWNPADACKPTTSPTRAPLLVDRRMIALGRACPGLIITGYDLATGAQRWQHPFPGSSDLGDISPIGGDRAAVRLLSANDSAHESVSIIDLVTGQEISHHTQAGSEPTWTAPGVRLRGCQEIGGHAPSAVCADDPATGRPLWQTPLPPPYRLLYSAAILASDDRVYALAARSGDESSLLVELDLHTGALLGQTPVPVRGTVFDLYEADYGVVLLSYEDMLTRTMAVLGES
jgi:outer membrane protein assembly factor BamB